MLDPALWCLTGVLAGAIDYYILDKFQRLTNTKTYTKVICCHLSTWPDSVTHSGYTLQNDGIQKVILKGTPVPAGKHPSGKEIGDGRLWDCVSSRPR